VITWRQAAATLVATAALAAAPVVFAENAAEPVESWLIAQKVVVVDGRESLVDAQAARPGDVIEYMATYRNAGKDRVSGLQATLPIPRETELIPGTVRPAGAKASVDGRTFADMPLRRTVVRNGRNVEEPVPYRDYRALRWFAGVLGSGAAVTYTARVRVIDERSADMPATRGGGK
jgi:uncharacterized repeat protein (TIGR01451 family)